MRLPAPLLLSLLLFPCGLAAQRTLVLPPAAAGVEQAGSTTALWGAANASKRNLVVYDDATIQAQGATGPFTITGLRWRANGGGGGNPGTYANVEIRMSTAAINYLSVTPLFASNHGGNLALAYSGPIAVVAATASTPSSFYVQVTLDTPFVYDPSAGDLAIDVQGDGTGWVGAAAAGVDLAQGVGAGSWVTANGAMSSTGSVTVNAAPVLELTTDLPAAAASLVINEFVYDYLGANREFVEIYNASGGAVNLQSWSLAATTNLGTTTLATLPSVLLGAGQYYVVGNTVVTPPTLTPDLTIAAALPNGTTTLVLRNSSGIGVDAVTYNAAAGGIPLLDGEGPPLFGAHQLQAASPTSWSRQRDGLDTGNNGLDFRIAPWTPKLSNNLASLAPYAANFDALAVGQAVPSWSGSVAAPVGIDPTVISTYNPKVVPASPQGLRCASFATPNDTAGARSFLLLSDAGSTFGYRALVYFDATLAPAGQSCSWSIGIGGTTDSNYARPYPTGPSNVDVNGDTGVGWTYQVTGTAAVLYLMSHAAGGTEHHLVTSIPITTSGWRTLRLDLDDNRLLAAYNGTTYEAHVANAHGGIYVGIDNGAGGAQIAALRVDDILVDDPPPSTIDQVGPGCDGNCPPKNNAAKVVDLDEPGKDKNAPLTQGYYAIPVVPPFNTANVAISFTGTCVLSQRVKSGTTPTATLQLLDGATAGAPGAAIAGAASTLQDPGSLGAGWWQTNQALTNRTQRFFIEFHHDGTLELPIAKSTTEPKFCAKTTTYYWFRGVATDPWVLRQREIAWAYKFACTSFSSQPQLELAGELKLGSIQVSTMGCTLPFTFALEFLSFGTGNLDLGVIGAPGCRLWLDLANSSSNLFLTNAAGAASSALFVPNNPTFLGIPIYRQWFPYDPSANSLGFLASNALGATIH